VKREA